MTTIDENEQNHISPNDPVVTAKVVRRDKAYIGCKIIRAEPMNQEAWLKSQNKWREGQETMGDGYKVVYDDNYASWSPKDVFDRCYREITDMEGRMVY